MLRISAGVGDHLCFLTFYNYMIPIDCKITNFSLYLYLSMQYTEVKKNRGGDLTNGA